MVHITIPLVILLGGGLNHSASGQLNMWFSLEHWWWNFNDAEVWSTGLGLCLVWWLNLLSILWKWIR